MSVLIKGMDMPKNCFMCYLSRLNGERLFCNVTGEEVLRYKIAPECPMTESTERKSGKWIVMNDDYIDDCKCSECGCIEYFNRGWKRFNFCPSCGAKMT